jgi:hypothetical protein
MASSSSEEEIVRFLLLDAGAGVALDLAGDLAAETPESEEGRGREDIEGCEIPNEPDQKSTLPKHGKIKRW